MAADRLAPVVRHIRHLAGLAADEGLPDGPLLQRFALSRDERAFEALFRRHAPLVWRVCGRVLGHAQDAEDAVQATFLVLARRAGSIRKPGSLASWLHGLAYRIARRARADAERRRSREREAARMPVSDPGHEAAWRELGQVLEEEVHALAEKYRLPLLLCYWEGKSYLEAARQLGCPEETVKTRLARARRLLQGRLAHRGVTLPARVVALLLAPSGAKAVVPAALVTATARSAGALGKAGGAAAVSDKVVALAEAGLKSMAVVKLKVGLVLALVVGVVAAAAGGAAHQVLGAKEGEAKQVAKERPAARTAERAKRKEERRPRTDRDGHPLPPEAVARVGSARLRHGPSLMNLTYSLDGKVLASSGGGLLRLWDAGTGRLLRSITVADGGRVPDGLFSADGKTVLALDGETCRWFAVRTGKEVRRCDVKFPMTESHACLAPGGEMIAVVGTQPGKDLVVYELPSGKERFRKTAGGSWCRELSFSPDGKTLAALEWEGKKHHVRLFDTAAGKPLGNFDAGETRWGLTFAPDGKKLLGNDFQKSLRVWHMPDGKPLHQVEPAVSALMTAAFSPDGTSVVVGSRGIDARVILIDLASGKERRRYPNNPNSQCLVFTPNGRTLAVGDVNGTISQWEVTAGKRLAASAGPVAGLGLLQQLRFDGDGKLLWLSPEALVATDWRSGREVRRVRLAHEGTMWDVALSPDLSRVAGVNGGGTPAVWDVASGKELCVLPTGRGLWIVRTFSPDGKTLYTCEWGGPVRAWDVSTGKERPALDKKQRFPWSLVVSPDGRWLAAADHPRALGGPALAGQPSEVTVWDLVKGQVANRLLPGPDAAGAWCLAFSPDGTRLAAVGGDQREKGRADTGRLTGGFVTAWDVRTGRKMFASTGLADHPMVVAFSADGRTLATGGWDGAVRLWEVATGQQRSRFVGHESAVFGVTFSPDGKLVAAASADAPVFVWDVTGCYGQAPSNTPFVGEEGARLWNDLRDADAAVAFKAMREMMSRPAPAVTLLRGRLRPVSAVSEEAVKQLLRDLDASDFAVREKAAAGLEEIADLAEPLLCKALERKPSVEVKRRVERVLEKLAGAPTLRTVRGIEALELIGTAEARQVLEALARGAPEARLTQEAKASLQCLAKQPTSNR